MKISNETKIGALTIVAITILILGFNYLKGKDVVNSDKRIFAVFKKVEGLTVSNPVMINGLQVGTVHQILEKNRTLDSIVVTVNLDKDVDIPNNSLCYINKDFLGSGNLTITMGNSPRAV